MKIIKLTKGIEFRAQKHKKKSQKIAMNGSPLVRFPKKK
jgi:hypothetical protein